MEPAAGSPTIKIDATSDPQDMELAEHVLWQVLDSAGEVVDQGNFGDGDPQVEIIPDGAARKFVVSMGIDADEDDVLDAGEKERTADVYVVPQFKIHASAFIKQEWVDHPLDGDYIFGGDDRMNANGQAEFSVSQGSYRLRMEGTVIPLKLYDSDGIADDGTEQKSVGYTRQYHKASSLDGNGNLTAAAKQDLTTGDDNLLHDEAQSAAPETGIARIEQSGQYTSVQFILKGNNPLIVSPNIFVTNTLAFDYRNPDDPKYKIVSTYRPFPAWQMYVNDKPVRLYDSGSFTPAALTAEPERAETPWLSVNTLLEEEE
jgi:hypothetical protein